MASRCINGWKEIAAALGVSVRTAQRWEAIAALPVHRLRSGTRGSVFALAGELERWQRADAARGSDCVGVAAAASPERAATDRDEGPQRLAILHFAFCILH